MKGYLLLAVIVVSLAIFVIPVSDVGNWLSKSVMDNHSFQNKIDFLTSLYEYEMKFHFPNPDAPWYRFSKNLNKELESLRTKLDVFTNNSVSYGQVSSARVLVYLINQLPSTVLFVN